MASGNHVQTGPLEVQIMAIILEWEVSRCCEMSVALVTDESVIADETLFFCSLFTYFL